MPGAITPLMLEFLAWIATRRRTYVEAMDAWRSTCPRHTVWEDALMDGLIQLESEGALHQSVVTLTPRGRAILDANAGHTSMQTDPLPGC